MRKLLLFSVIIFSALVFLIQLGSLQISEEDIDAFKTDPAISTQTIYSSRGFIYDRNGALLVANQAAYDLMVIPREVQLKDTLAFCKLIKINKETFSKQMEIAYKYSPRLPSVMVSKLSKETYAAFQEKMRKYKGFYIQKQNLRDYKTVAAANVLGYISEVNPWEVKNYPNYNAGELIGKTGVEKQYEYLIRGEKGVKYIQKDRFNRLIGPYKSGTHDIIPVSGTNITITLDKALQEYGEQLMVGKRGAIVAIEPTSGEILALVTGPNFDPSLLIGRERSKNYTQLYYDSIAKPTWDRSLLAQPSPGSPFKLINGLAALEEGVIDPNEIIYCNNGYYVGRDKKTCHCGGGRRNLQSAIALSCNAYFVHVFKKIFKKYPSSEAGIDAWVKHMKSFGLGEFLGTDLPTGAPGRIPNKELYDGYYGKNRWRPTYFISNAIGQGEVATTPIQLANMSAIIANRGFYFRPHILKKIGNTTIQDSLFTSPQHSSVSKKHFTPIIHGMQAVYEIGTAKHLKVSGISMAGKTGTSENYTRINGIRKQLTDHSIFIGFAPVETPKIAISVYIEHGYYGSRYAGYIATLMMEKYLTGAVSKINIENKILGSSLEKEYAKPLSGKDFKINEYAW
jgi:penicillin-binding protein 2